MHKRSRVRNPEKGSTKGSALDRINKGQRSNIRPPTPGALTAQTPRGGIGNPVPHQGSTENRRTLTILGTPKQRHDRKAGTRRTGDSRVNEESSS